MRCGSRFNDMSTLLNSNSSMFAKVISLRSKIFKLVGITT